MRWLVLIVLAVLSALLLAWGRLIWKLVAFDDHPKAVPRERDKSDRPWERF